MPNDNRNMTLLVLLALFFVLPRSLWPIVAMLVFVNGWKGVQNKFVNTPTSTENIWTYYDNLISGKVVNSSPHTFRQTKAPKRLVYIHRHPNLVYVMEDMYVFRNYQSEILADMLILLEHFCKVHYNVMLGKYDVSTNVQVLIDMKHAIVRLFDDFIFNLPSISTVLYIQDIDQYVEERKTHVHGVLNRFLQILRNKYPNESEGLLAFACT